MNNGQNLKRPLLKQPSTFTEPLTYRDRLFFRAVRIHIFGPVTFIPVKYEQPNLEQTVPFLWPFYFTERLSIFDHMITSASFDRPLYT